jgi:hypothetical protein
MILVLYKSMSFNQISSHQLDNSSVPPNQSDLDIVHIFDIFIIYRICIDDILIISYTKYFDHHS